MSDGMSDMIKEERDTEIRNSLYGVQILNDPSLKAGVYAQMDARDAYIAKEKSDGSTASYYELPNNASELQDLISAKNMNYSVGSIFVLCCEHGEARSVQSRIYIVKGIIKHAEYERKRLEAMYPM
jgi:hypothetical protein